MSTTHIDPLVEKLQILQARYAASQFALDLHPLTLLPLDLAAGVIGKTVTTFRSDLVRQPQVLPPVVRRGGRVWVQVADLLDWLRSAEPVVAAAAGTTGSKRKRGRPTKTNAAEKMNRGAK